MGEFALNYRSGVYTKTGGLLLTALFLFFLSLYILTSSGQLVIIDANSMYSVAKEIVEKGNFEIPREIQGVPYKGKFYSHYGIGSSVVMMPFYIAGKLLNNYLPRLPGDGMPKAMVSLSMSFVMASACCVFYSLARIFGYSEKVSLLLSLLYGLATMVWNYSKYAYSDTPGGFFLLLGVYQLVAFGKNVRRANFTSLFLSGLFLGFAVSCRMEMLLLVPAAAVYLLCILKKNAYLRQASAKAVAAFFLPVIAILILIAIYNYLRFDSWLETGSRIWDKLGIYPFGIRSTTRALGVTSYWTAFSIGIYAYLFSPGKGIFFYQPVLLLSLFGLRQFYKRHSYETVLFLALVFINVVIHSNLIAMHTGGWSWGPRYLLTTLPFLFFPAGFIFQDWSAIKKPKRLAAAAIILISVVIQIASVCVDSQRFVLEFKKRQGIDFNDNREIDWGKPVYDVRHSPLPGQFLSLAKVIRSMASGKARQFKARFSREEKAAMDEIDLNLNSLQLNVLNFWWVKLYYLGFPRRVLIMSVGVLLAIFLSCSAYLYGYLKKEDVN